MRLRQKPVRGISCSPLTTRSISTTWILQPDGLTQRMAPWATVSKLGWNFIGEASFPVPSRRRFLPSLVPKGKRTLSTFGTLEPDPSRSEPKRRRDASAEAGLHAQEGERVPGETHPLLKSRRVDSHSFGWGVHWPAVSDFGALGRRIWLILPANVCFSQGLSHARLR